MSDAWGDGRASVYETKKCGDALMQAFLCSPIIVGHNIAYDMACAIEWLDEEVAAAVWKAYAEDRIVCTRVFERLGEIAKRSSRKMLSLDVCCQAHGLPPLDKGSGVRTDYGWLLDRPIEDYPEAYIKYSRDDSVANLKLYARQLERYSQDVRHEDVAFLTRKEFWLQLTRNYGMRTAREKLTQLRAETEAHVDELMEFAQEAGFVRENGTKNMKAIKAYVAEAYNGRPPKTKASEQCAACGKPEDPACDKHVATSKAVLQESGDPVLEVFADYGEWAAVKNKDLPMLELGADWPIHTKWGIADTTRTTSSKPNVQNLRRKEGIRECFVPREGNCYVAADHGGLENATLAQVIVTNLGRWDMADKINNGEDLHCHVGAQIAGVSYDKFYQLAKVEEEPEAKNQRNCAKVVNFGRPGGMGAKTLKLYAKQSYGIEISQPFAKELIDHWNAANPDGMAYLDWIGSLPEDRLGRREITIPGTKIIRRGATYCAAANSHFQGLGAVVEAWVGWRIAREIYEPGSKSPLRWARMCNFVHDEFILECPIGRQTEVAERLQEIMQIEARSFLPDIRIDADAVAMAYWSKRAKRIVKDGELQIWH